MAPYGQEGLAGREATLWLHEKSLTIEHGGEPLSRFAVEAAAGSGRFAGKLRVLGRPRLSETSHALPRLRLFGLDALGETGWLTALRLEDHAPRRLQRPRSLQQALFAYHAARGRGDATLAPAVYPGWRIVGRQ